MFVCVCVYVCICACVWCVTVRSVCVRRLFQQIFRFITWCVSIIVCSYSTLLKIHENAIAALH